MIFSGSVKRRRMKDLKLEIMKKTINMNKSLVVLVSILVLGACQDVLDEVPSDKLSIDRLLNKNAIVNFRSNSYGHLNNSFNGNSAGQLLEAYTDDAFRAGTTATLDWHGGFLTPENNIFANSIWRNNWAGIRKTNLALLYLPQSRVSKVLISDAEIERWMDEVKVLRAWYHFELIRNFGPVPFVDEVYGPDFTGWNDLTRPTYEEISSILVDELDDVITANRLPLRYTAASEFDKINMALAHALKSRILLYNASALNNTSDDQSKWQRAADATQAAITAISSEYSLVDLSDYADLFNEDNLTLNSEIIYRASSNGTGTLNNQNGVDLSTLGSATQSDNAGAVPTQELVDSFELTDGTLPVADYTNAQHTSATLNPGYSENEGDDPYADRDARFYHAIVYNGANYGRVKGSNTDIFVHTYEGKPGTGFNNNPTSQENADRRRSTTGYYTRKFRSAGYWGSSAGGTNSYKIHFRLAELYLNLAEAQAQLGNISAAISALDVVRERAGQPAISDVPGFQSNEQFLLSRIRNERRVELCFEGHRFYDQRRWDILSETNGVVSGMRITSTGGDAGPFTYIRTHVDVARNATSDKYLVLPIPTEEARRLTGLGQPAAWQ